MKTKNKKSSLRLFISILVFIIIVLGISFFIKNKTINFQKSDIQNTNTTEKIVSITDKQNQNIDLKWKFIYTGDQSDGTIQTEVSLVVIKNNKEEEIKLGNYQSKVEQITNFSNRDIPQDTIMMCAGWNGGGDNIAVVKKDNQVLIYYEEVIDHKDAPTPKYQLIKSLDLFN